MADLQSHLRAHEVFWSREESDADTPWVQGLQDPGNRRKARPTSIKCRKTQEVKPGIPVSRKPVSETYKPPPPTKVREKKHASKASKAKMEIKVEDNERSYKASLKELRPEDKQRVANLINELARVGQDKQRFADELTSERKNFDVRMKGLAEQHENILREREGVQQQLLDCQRLLARYQNLVSEQQDALSAPNEHTTNTQAVQCHLPSPGPVTNTKKNHEPHYTEPGPSNNQSNRPLSPASKSSSEPCGADISVLGPKKRTLPESVSTERPFTQYIDNLIAREQSGSKPDHSEQSHSNKSGDQSKATSHGSKTSSTYPLHEPVLSSTQQSDFLSTSRQSRTKAGEFLPLQPDPSPRSSLQSPGPVHHPLDAFNPHHSTLPRYDQNGAKSDSIHREIQDPYHSVDGQPEEARVTFSEQLRQPSPQGLHSPTAQPGEDQFITYYKSMTSAERQNHLMSQKAALLAEQQRLRQILEEQEKLLCTKQQQLRLQHDVQLSNLAHFEKNGFFPQDPMPLDPLHEILEPILPPPPMPHEQISQNEQHLDMLDDRIQAGRLQSAQEVGLPDQLGGFGHRSNPTSSDSHYQPLFHPNPNQPRTHPMHHSVGGNSANPYREVHGTSHGSEPITDGLELSREEIEAVTDSMENIWFLQRRGVDVPQVNKVPPKKPPRSAGSFPHRQRAAAPVHNHRVHILEELINEDSRDHATCLLELVNQVENSHAVHHSPLSSCKRRSDPGHLVEVQVPELPVVAGLEEEEEEEEEESRILEEVFFVR